MVENQLNNDEGNDKDTINSFTYNQTWLKLVYATNSGLIIVDSEEDNVDATSRIDEKTLSLLENIDKNDRIYIENNIIHYITYLEDGGFNI